MSEPIFTKVYTDGRGRLKFRIEVYGKQISLKRLPILPDQIDGEYVDSQMCTVYLKETITHEDLGWDDEYTHEELIEQFNENAGHESELYAVAEYTGREQSSENLTPDTALDGFLEWEIGYALQTLDQDQELYKLMISLAVNGILLNDK
jgi:hypothetical protein